MEKRPVILVTTRPLLEMATAVCGTGADVALIVPDDVLSTDWKPEASAVRRLQQADLILLSGAGHEPWQERIALPGSRTRNTSAGFASLVPMIPDSVVHRHGPRGAGSSAGIVRQFWLDPELALAQLNEVSRQCAKLLKRNPEGPQESAIRFQQQLESHNQQFPGVSRQPAADRADSTTGGQLSGSADETATESSGDSGSLRFLSDGPWAHVLVRRLGGTLVTLQLTDAAADFQESDRAELAQLLAEGTEQDAESRPRVFLMSAVRSADCEAFVTSLGLTVVRVDLCEHPDSSGRSFPERMSANVASLQRVCAP